MTASLERVLRAFLDEPAAPRYGYDLMKAAGLQSGTLYPLLARLEQQKLVTSAWETPAAGGSATQEVLPAHRRRHRGCPAGARTVGGHPVLPAQAGGGRARPSGPREPGVRGERALLRLGESLVHRACRRLPGPTRDDRYREWAAELPAILHDPE